VVLGISYYANYLSSKEASSLRSALLACRHDKWVTLPTTQRRLQQWGGMPGSPDPAARGPFPLPQYQQHLAQRLVAEKIFPRAHLPNHCLINAYTPGQGILPHQDGPAYYPKVAILSLAQTVILSFRHTVGDLVPVTSIVLAPNSLVVFEGDAYHRCLHSIDACVVETTKGKNVINATGNGAVIERTQDRLSVTLRFVGGAKDVAGKKVAVAGKGGDGAVDVVQ
jgi:alkylated DNA repair protein alkB family protein 6